MIRIGTAAQNWSHYTHGQPDASDNNKVVHNSIAHVTAKDIDVKGGTAGSEVAFNQT